MVGDLSLDDVLSKREEMNGVLRLKLDDVTERWGVKVTNVEVREIKPPPAVLEAMTRQMGAERARRALVTEAEGQKQASITVAEGEKQSAILQAEGERQSAELRAQGFAAALKRILEVAGDVDQTTMTLQYLETLKQIGSSPSTKFVVPVELTNMLAGLVNVKRRPRRQWGECSVGTFGPDKGCQIGPRLSIGLGPRPTGGHGSRSFIDSF